MYVAYTRASPRHPCVSARHSDVSKTLWASIGDAWLSLDASEVYSRRPAAYPPDISGENGCMADARCIGDTPLGDGVSRYVRASPIHREMYPIHPGVSHTLRVSGRRPGVYRHTGCLRYTPVSGRHPRVYGIRRWQPGVSRRPRVYRIHAGVFNTP
jgi:hypothetical protein